MLPYVVKWKKLEGTAANKISQEKAMHWMIAVTCGMKGKKAGENTKQK